uniref:Uncharacterized protein n=1 Tax=Arundo donax TaxID=35708 RepID=A0A0A9FIN7_ARUDO
MALWAYCYSVQATLITFDPYFAEATMFEYGRNLTTADNCVSFMPEYLTA